MRKMQLPDDADDDDNCVHCEKKGLQEIEIGNGNGNGNGAGGQRRKGSCLGN